MSIGDRIKTRRKQLGMSAETLAERIGKSPATVYRYEKGDIGKVDSRIIPLIADALSVEPADLMGWEDDDTRYNALLDDVEAELIRLYRSLNRQGRNMLIRTARSYSKDDEYKGDGQSNDVTA